MAPTPGSDLLAIAQAIFVWSKRWMEDGSRKPAQLPLIAKDYSSASEKGNAKLEGIFWQTISVLSAWSLIVILLINIPLSYLSLPQGSSLTIQLHTCPFPQPSLPLATLTSNFTYSLSLWRPPSRNGNRNKWKNRVFSADTTVFLYM